MKKLISSIELDQARAIDPGPLLGLDPGEKPTVGTTADLLLFGEYSALAKEGTYFPAQAFHESCATHADAELKYAGMVKNTRQWICKHQVCQKKITLNARRNDGPTLGQAITHKLVTRAGSRKALEEHVSELKQLLRGWLKTKGHTNVKEDMAHYTAQCIGWMQTWTNRTKTNPMNGNAEVLAQDTEEMDTAIDVAPPKKRARETPNQELRMMDIETRLQSTVTDQIQHMMQEIVLKTTAALRESLDQVKQEIADAIRTEMRQEFEERMQQMEQEIRTLRRGDSAQTIEVKMPVKTSGRISWAERVRQTRKREMDERAERIKATADDDAQIQSIADANHCGPNEARAILALAETKPALRTDAVTALYVKGIKQQRTSDIRMAMQQIGIDTKRIGAIERVGPYTELLLHEDYAGTVAYTLHKFGFTTTDDIKIGDAALLKNAKYGQSEETKKRRALRMAIALRRRMWQNARGPTRHFINVSLANLEEELRDHTKQVRTPDTGNMTTQNEQAGQPVQNE